MMKKLLSIALIAVAVSANAQEFKLAKPHSNPVNFSNPNFRLSGNNQVQSTIDTLRPASIIGSGCASAPGSLVYYNVDQVAPLDSGYYFGTGLFPAPSATITEVAQKYPSGTSGLSVTNVLTLAAKASGTTATTSAKIYAEAAGTLKPGTLLGTSTALAMAAYTTTGYNNYVFGAPVSVGANVNFFAAITVPLFGGADMDTMAIISTQLGCSSTDSLSWMQIMPYGYYHVKYLFGANLDLMIFPVVTISTTGVNAYSKGDLNLFAASPNPTSNSVNINFSLNNSSKVEIEVIDLTGKVVKTIKGNDTFSTGKHALSVDVSNLESGSYMYSINAGGVKLFSKFVVTK